MSEEKLEEVRRKYSEALRDGDTDKATEMYWKAEDLKGNVEEPESSEDESENALRRDLVYSQEFDGVGEELSEEIYQEYGDWDEFVENVTFEGLVDISGIGEKRAEQIMSEVE